MHFIRMIRSISSQLHPKVIIKFSNGISHICQKVIGYYLLFVCLSNLLKLLLLNQFDNHSSTVGFIIFLLRPAIQTQNFKKFYQKHTYPSIRICFQTSKKSFLFTGKVKSNLKKISVVLES